LSRIASRREHGGCFLPIHVYDTATSRPVAVILRPGKTPSGQEVRAHLRRLVRRIRQHWPTTQITIRGDGHYARPEVMAWCEDNGIDYVLGLPGNAVLARAVDEGRRRYPDPPRARRDAVPARLRRDPLSGQVVDGRAPRLRPHRRRLKLQRISSPDGFFCRASISLP
jgi:hypothetical protein